MNKAVGLRLAAVAETHEKPFDDMIAAMECVDPVDRVALLACFAHFVLVEEQTQAEVLNEFLKALLDAVPINNVAHAALQKHAKA